MWPSQIKHTLWTPSLSLCFPDVQLLPVIWLWGHHASQLHGRTKGEFVCLLVCSPPHYHHHHQQHQNSTQTVFVCLLNASASLVVLLWGVSAAYTNTHRYTERETTAVHERCSCLNEKARWKNVRMWKKRKAVLPPWRLHSRSRHDFSASVCRLDSAVSSSSMHVFVGCFSSSVVTGFLLNK